MSTNQLSRIRRLSFDVITSVIADLKITTANLVKRGVRPPPTSRERALYHGHVVICAVLHFMELSPEEQERIVSKLLPAYYRRVDVEVPSNDSASGDGKLSAVNAVQIPDKPARKHDRKRKHDVLPSEHSPA